MKNENVIKITLEGAEQYKKQMQEMKAATAELRKEVEQLNLALEKKEELLNRLR